MHDTPRWLRVDGIAPLSTGVSEKQNKKTHMSKRKYI